MLERALIAVLIAAVSVAAWTLYNRWSLRRLSTQAPVDPLLADVAQGTPTIVYFTTPFCVPCKTQQQPVLTQLEGLFGAGLRIVRVDAAEDTATSDRWGVFSAPTTFVLDGHLRPQYVNRGVASFDLLRQQIETAGQKAG
ncbi:MAG: thioredoxin family protein [Anaerolineae bacterium]|nr:thioredoxin family protein [Anaerolineae bacterium]